MPAAAQKPHPEVMAVEVEGVLLLRGPVGTCRHSIVAVVRVGVQVLYHQLQHLALQKKD
jgi:hypothetical protein